MSHLLDQLQQALDRARYLPSDLNEERVAAMRELAARQKSEQAELKAKQLAERLELTRSIGLDHAKRKLDLESEIKACKAQISLTPSRP